jgi:deoxyribonuclease V
MNNQEKDNHHSGLNMSLYEGLSLTDAANIQNNLRHKLDLKERPLQLTTIGGADISLNLYSTTVYAGIIVLSFPQLKPLYYSLVKAETRFPYIPGFLAFREVPALLRAWQQLTDRPDVLVVDGHGITHPRRMGIASHFGALTDASK